MPDLQKVNQWARDMVDAGFGTQTKFFQLTNGQLSSELARAKYEQDIQTILKESAQRVRTLLTSHDATWKAVAEALLE